MKSTKYFNNLDAFKGIAILGVMLAHCGATDLGGRVGKLSAAGARGVQIFLIISSVLIFKSLKKEYEKAGNISLKAWYIKRFLRLIPLYYIANLLVLIKDGFGSSYWSGTHGITAGTIVSNFFFIHGMYPWWCNAININWYIGILALFIVAAPLLYHLIDHVDKLFILLGFSWLCSIICMQTIGTIDLGADNYVWITYWGSFSIIAQFPVLVLGMILYYFIEKTNAVMAIKQHLGKKTKSFCYAVVGVCLLWLYFVIGHGGAIVEYALIFVALIFISFIDKLYLIENPIFKNLGKYSYGIYLFHYPLLEITHKFFIQYINNSNIEILISYIVVIILSFIISWILVNFVEKPIITKAQKAFDK